MHYNDHTLITTKEINMKTERTEYSHFRGYGDIQRNTIRHNVKQQASESCAAYFIAISLAFIAYVAYDIVSRGA